MTTRKHFFAVTAALAAVPVLGDAAPVPAPKPSATPGFPKLDFDERAYGAQLDRDVAHKHLFASKALGDGAVLDNMRATLNAYKTLGTAWSQIAMAAVLYHVSMPLGLNDAMWKRYVIPYLKKLPRSEAVHAKDLTEFLGSAKGNPALATSPGDWDSSIPSLIRDAGARFYVCNNAAMGFAGEIAKRLKTDRLRVYADFRTNLVPNAMLVPAGVWAIHNIQEHKYTLLQSS